MNARENMRECRDGEFITPEPISPLTPKRTKKEMKLILALLELKTAVVKALDVACNIDRDHAPTEHERCSGNTAIWKDDESGASSSWDTIVRRFEDSR